MNLGFSETAFLVILGLLLFGPKKLPEIGRQIGRFMAEFKRASAEFQSQLNDEVRQWEDQVEETKRTILPPLGITAREEPAFKTIEAPPSTGPEERTGETPAPEDARSTREAEDESQQSLSGAVTQGPNA